MFRAQDNREKVIFHKINLALFAALAMTICLGACSPSGDTAPSGEASTPPDTPSASEAPPTPAMPADWKVVSDFVAPAGQVGPMSEKLGAKLSSVRNTVYDVNGKRVQLNIIVTPDAANADKLMVALLGMKSEQGVLRKDLVIYEFVGPNDVLPEIAQGRSHLDSM